MLLSGGRNRFPVEGVRALSSGDLPPGAAERKSDGHLLLGAAWDEFGVNKSRSVGLESAARHVRDGRRSPDGSLGGGAEWRGVARVRSEERMGKNMFGVG